MTYFQYIARNQKQINDLIRKGKLSCMLVGHLAIYCYYDNYKRQGNTHGDAIFYAAEEFRVCIMTVYRVIKEMEEEGWD